MGHTSTDSLVVKPAGEKAVRNRHHWLFSGAIECLPNCENGSLVPVVAENGEHLGHAYFNRRCALTARMVNFDRTPPIESIRLRLKEAVSLRRKLLQHLTNAWRVINAEGDEIPGLILDRYADLCVMQIGTLGMDRLRDRLVDMIGEACGAVALYERSGSPSRRQEGLTPREAWLVGSPRETVDFIENGLSFRIRTSESQKTGFFLDQRAMRAWVRDFARDRRVLDCFSYEGGFAVAALGGGAVSVDLVDSSRAALEQARENVALNGFPAHTAEYLTEDAFGFLRSCRNEYDMVTLDPPAFAKRKADVVKACRGYKDINRLALRTLRPGGLLFTFSCSYHVDTNLFQTVVFQAASEADRRVRILGRHRQAPDHPTNIFHPETEYLKGLVLYVL